jgi:Ca2+-binding EF-hand superfamily protein
MDAGRLSQADFVRGMVDAMPRLGHRPALRRAFQAADVDKAGVITRREFRLALQHALFYHQQREAARTLSH